MQARILVVEDNCDNMYVLDRILSYYGHVVQQATDGREALQMMMTMSFDLVLMDMQMPGLDGYSTVRAVREIPNLRTLPVIAVTVSSMPGDRERSIEAGCTDYVAKPIDTHALIQLVARYVGGAGHGDNPDR